jgi:hypothetical protein
VRAGLAATGLGAGWAAGREGVEVGGVVVSVGGGSDGRDLVPDGEGDPVEIGVSLAVLLKGLRGGLQGRLGVGPQYIEGGLVEPW